MTSRYAHRNIQSRRTPSDHHHRQSVAANFSQTAGLPFCTALKLLSKPDIAPYSLICLNLSITRPSKPKNPRNSDFCSRAPSILTCTSLSNESQFQSRNHPRAQISISKEFGGTLVLVWHKSANTTSTTSCTYNTDLYIYTHIHFGLRTLTLQPALLSNLHGCCKG